jgi:hypothetical protein
MHLFPVQAIRSDMPSFHRAAVFLNDRLNRLSRRRLLHEIAGQTVIGEQTFDLGQQPLIAGANFLQIGMSLLWRLIERGVENLFALSPSGFPISNYPSSVVHLSLQRERIALADRAVKPGFGHPPLG